MCAEFFRPSCRERDSSQRPLTASLAAWHVSAVKWRLALPESVHFSVSVMRAQASMYGHEARVPQDSTWWITLSTGLSSSCSGRSAVQLYLGRRF